MPLVSRTLTIVGASVRAAAQSAARAGFSVHGADLFADLDLARVCEATRVADYPRGLVTVLSGPQDGGWMYTGALENHAALVGRWARLRLLWGNDGRVLRHVRDPWRVARALRSAGMLSPEIAPKGTLPPRDGNWLIKPVRSASGSHVMHWDSRVPDPVAPRGPSYFQRYVEGLACSAVYVAAGGQAVFLGVTRQLTGQRWTCAGGFRYCGSIGPLELPSNLAQSFIDIGAVLARAFKLDGLFGVDAVLNSQGIWPVEVNPRFTASTELVDWACGISAVELHVAACCDGRLPRDLPLANRMCGKAIVFAAKHTIVDVDLNASARTDSGRWPALADIPAIGTTIEAGWPIVTVLTEGSGENQVLEKLQRQAEEVRTALGDSL